MALVSTNINYYNPWSQNIFPFICVSFNFFNQSLSKLWVYRSFTSLVTFVHKYIVVFDTIINGVVFIISFPDILLFLDSSLETINFCVLILYPRILLNLMITSNSSFGGVFRIFYIYNHSNCKQRQFYFFLSYCMSFIYLLPNCSLPCWMGMVRVSILVLFLILKENHSVFPYYDISYDFS